MDFLSIDFAVVTRDGDPVDDLSAAEVTIRIGGRPRTVRSLQHMAVAAPEADGAPLPPPFGTNAQSDTGRTITLVIEDDSFRTGREAVLREAADAMLDRLSPRDRVSLVTLPYGGVKVLPTTEHARVRTALSRVTGHATGQETGSQLACRTRATLEALVGYFDGLGIRETPLTVVFITGGMAAPRRDAPVMMAPGMCELRRELFQEVGAAAGAARAMFYIVPPTEIAGGGVQRENIAGVGFAGSDNPMEGVEHLAGVTGGKILNLTGSSDGALGRIVRETASHYLASVDIDRSDRTGRTQPLDIRVNRPGVEVRTRPQIAFARPEPGGPVPANPSPRDMLAVTTPFRDLPMRVAAYSALDADGRSLRIVTIAEPADADVRLGALVAALFDREGKLVSHWAATSDELQRAPVVGAMPADTGAYRLRVAAIDASGRAGTADYEFDAEITETGPLKISSLILGLSREGRFIPKLQFGTEPVAIGYLELYGAPAGTRISTALEIARTLNGPPMAAVPLAIEAAAEGRYVAKGAIPIGSLPAGDYIVRALVGVEGQALTRVVRTLRKGG
ncbi:MAG TPA: hypothetical protein VM364_03125 [Vicinamibacterales bacterium]|nr:hypothetical protein [Vicinamibacterales bacterium]